MKTRTRTQISDELNNTYSQISDLKAKLLELQIEDLLLCDERQWYSETDEEFVMKKRPKTITTRLIGRRHWKEIFVDESTGDNVVIERCEIVRINGEWL